jgi:hypothetical protein
LVFQTALSVFSTLPLLAESRIWTSTSGSTIEANYIGVFDEVLWVEATQTGRILKMPRKYVSATDIEVIQNGTVAPLVRPGSVDCDIESLALLEALLTSDSPSNTSKDAQPLSLVIKTLIKPIQETRAEDKKIPVKFSRRKDQKILVSGDCAADNTYLALCVLAQKNGLALYLREGGIVFLRSQP